MAQRFKEKNGYSGIFLQMMAAVAAMVGILFALSLVLRSAVPSDLVKKENGETSSYGLSVLSSQEGSSGDGESSLSSIPEKGEEDSSSHKAPSSSGETSSEGSAAQGGSSGTVSSSSSASEDPYPDMGVSKPDPVQPEKGDKVVYLTFDDGPSDLTLPLLDVLDRYNVKATFFNVGIRGETAETAMKETVRRGHVLAVHTYTHEFRSVYASKEAYFEDFKKEWDYIYSVTGVKPDIFRFPGGSINGFNKGTAREIINEMNRRGYTYFDWNVDSGDATGNGIPPQTIYNNVISGVQGKNKAVVLMHNTNRKQTTLDILPKIIEKLQSMGYRFDMLTNQVEPVQFRITG